MKLLYSKTGVPYIEMDDDNKFIFSSSTKSKKGYKWLVFSGTSTTTTTMSAGKGKSKKKTKVTYVEPVSTIIDMKVTSIPKKLSKTDNIYLSKNYLLDLRSILKPFLDDEGYLHEKHLNELETALSSDDNIITDEDMMNEDPVGYYEDDEDDE
jgi:hypothetical protein